MTTRYYFTRRNGAEEVLHVGETDTLVGFRSNPGIAAALAELKQVGGEAAIAVELSSPEFDAKKCALGL